MNSGKCLRFYLGKVPQDFVKYSPLTLPAIINAYEKAAAANAASEKAAFKSVVEKDANEKMPIAQQITVKVINQLLRIQLLNNVSDDVQKQVVCALKS